MREQQVGGAGGPDGEQQVALNPTDRVYYR